MTTIAYEIDHAGPRDFRVVAVQENGKREWCQTYRTRREAEAGKSRLERTAPPKRTPAANALREARRAVSRARAALEIANEWLCGASVENRVHEECDALRAAVEAYERMLSKRLGPADNASYLVNVAVRES